MIDYHAHVAAVAATRDTFAAATSGDFPEEASRLENVTGENLSLAWLGSCIDAMLALTDTEGSELALLGKASRLWQRVLTLYEELGTARIEFELALLRDDIENPLDVLNMGFSRLGLVRDSALDMEQELKEIRAEIRKLQHIAPHPRQTDAVSGAWRWGDAFLGRRSWAFVEAMFANAADDRGTALAAGALAGYAGNVAGSAYLGHAVGGPRRLHRFRDRLARNTLGAYLRDRSATPALGEIAAEIVRAADPQRRDPPELAPDLAQQIANAIAAAFPSRPPVDIGLGLQRMIEHLGLLETFRMPKLPEPPPMIMGADGAPLPIDASGFDPDLKPQDLGGPGTGLGGGGPSTGSQTDPDSASSSSGKCGALALLIALILFIVIYLIWCIVRTAEGRTCAVEDYLAVFGTEEEPDPREPTRPHTEDALTVMRQPENAAHLINDIFSVQMKLWQGLEAARGALILHGLIYPESRDLSLALHKQFLVPFADAIWPRSAVPDAETKFEGYPMTSAEQPSAPNPFPDNREPDWLMAVSLTDNHATFSEIALEAFQNLQAGNRDAPNLDLDADRGRRHACWKVANGTSITDPVLAVEILPLDGQ